MIDATRCNGLRLLYLFEVRRLVLLVARGIIGETTCCADVIALVVLTAEASEAIEGREPEAL